MRGVICGALTVLLLGCNNSYIEPKHIELAEQYCSLYGGWDKISNDAVLCNLPNVVDNFGRTSHTYTTWDEIREELWDREHVAHPQTKGN